MKIKEIIAKSIITPSKLPDTDYVINPYTGCQFACLYCYASFMGRFVNEPIENWGNYVYVKSNAVELFKKEIKSLKKNHPNSDVLLSSVTDPYHGIEKTYRLTQGILKIFAQEEYEGLVSILTKSPLVLEDLNIINSILNIEVGITITSTNDRLSRFVEVKAPQVSTRLKTLEKLNESKVKTYAFVGPLLPHLQLSEGVIDDLFNSIVKTGTTEIYLEHINLSSYIKKRLWEKLENESDSIKSFYIESQNKAYRDKLDKILMEKIEKYSLKLRLNKAIYHKTL